MNKCYYLEINYKPRVKHGVWADKADAEAKAAELNQRFKKEWDDHCREKREEVARLQERWNALKAAGLSEGARPVLWDGYNAEWKPGIGGTEYYSVRETEFFEANKEAWECTHSTISPKTGAARSAAPRTTVPACW